MILRRLMCVLAYIIIGILLFLTAQHVLTYKWFYPVDGNDPKYCFQEFYDITDDSDIQVLFLGTSHVYCGVNPMEIYRETGITAYDLATSAQPIETSCAILKDALTRTKPKCVFLDVGSIFRIDVGSSYYRRVLDNMEFGPAKARLAMTFANLYGGEHKEGAYLGAFFPMYEYHARWSELSETDFSFDMNRNLYTKGFVFFNVLTAPAGLDVKTMNAIDEKRNSLIQDVVDGTTVDKSTNAKIFNGYEIPADNLECLLEMKQMCDKVGAEFHLFKVPSMNYPQLFMGSWTASKSKAIAELSDFYGIPFLDLMYDVDLSLDWASDSIDAGAHLNAYGAEKVSAYMATYLRDACGLKGEANHHYEEDLPTYNDVDIYVRQVGIRKLGPYLESLSQMDDICVFFSAYEDMQKGLRPEDMAALNAFGLNTDFGKMMDCDAFLAIVDEGNLVYEATSNSPLKKEGVLEDGLSYLLISSGWYKGSKSSILLRGVEYSIKKSGLNIVVYDKKSQMVVDSLCFDTSVEGDQLAMRSRSGKYLRNYSNWRAREDYKQGIR